MPRLYPRGPSFADATVQFRSPWWVRSGKEKVALCAQQPLASTKFVCIVPLGRDQVPTQLVYPGVCDEW
jgi:hypothetical protein